MPATAVFPHLPRGMGPVLVGLLLASAGCTPALDWRDVRVDGGAASGLLPCRPTVQERQVQLVGRSVTMGLKACAAAGQTWALAQSDLGDPGLVAAALDELVRLAALNIGAAASEGRAVQVLGATPNPRARRVSLQGRGAGGAAVRMEVQVFTLGTRVFQATALGAALDADALDTFFGGLRAHP